jgi:hypothetical protein
MDEIKASDPIDHHRRRFFGMAAMTVAASQLGSAGHVPESKQRLEPRSARPVA